MRKIKLLGFLSLVMIFAFALNACGENAKVKSFDVVLNKDYNPDYGIVENVSEVSELSGMRFLNAKGEFMTFSGGSPEGGVTITVFSTRNKKAVYSETSSATEAIEVLLYSGMPAFTVVKTALGACADTVGSSVCELYDATGALVASSKNPAAKPISFADTVLFDLASYSVSKENGALTKISDISENLYVEDCSEWNDKYFYTYGENINVYTREFEHIYSWSYPSWAEKLSANALNDGSVLVQYLRPLDNLTEKYDIYEMDETTGEIKKYELTTVLLNPAEKVEKEVELDFVVNYISTENELALASEESGMYAKGFENIAYIHPIVDKQVDSSDKSADIAVMNNGGKLEGSLKIVENQIAALPTYINDGTYILTTTYGSALVDINGQVLYQMNNGTVSTTDNNIVSDGYIYTIGMEEVYSLYDNGAEVITYLNGTAFLRKGTDVSYTIVAVNGKDIKEVCAYDYSDNLSTYFDELTDSGCYALCNVVESKYLYYSSEHKLIYSSTARLDKVASDFERNVTLYSTTVEGETKYYIFY